MARSLKKGPFVDDHLIEKVEALNSKNEKRGPRRALRPRNRGSTYRVGGTSCKTILGSRTSARARPTRFCMPPEICAGNFS